jgi:SAM-dependent methyltransferase
MQIDCYDLRGSWADDFETYLAEHKDTLAEGTAINLCFEDVEVQETWESIAEREPYDFIVAHYLTGFIKDLELFLERVADVLASGGMFSVNVAGASREHGFWQELFTKLQLKTDFMIESEAKSRKRLEGFLTILEKYFTKVENTVIENLMRYEDAEELFARLLERYPENKKYLTDKERVIKEYFVQEMEARGAIVVPTSSDFQHCFK